ncbi:exonuclease V [Trametes gibbosa]|nr:exonuclease V [Trametes gibbosa]
MSGTDEYDAFYPPIDHQDLVDIEAAAIAAYSLREASRPPAPPLSQESLPDSSASDEFDVYDFSEFTADDFVHIDALVLAHTPDIPTPPNDPIDPPPAQPQTARRGSDAVKSRRISVDGGPRVEIGFEETANANPRSRVKGSSRRTPFQQFRSWKGMLSVTDLVGPSWCEVQFDYGLRQKRYKKLEDRPTSFVTAEGKTIEVVQNVAAQNDRTVTRGKSVHKVLEREVQPETVAVDITTQEERWGLRLINMLASLETLTEVGYCREMPVFGVVHGQVVTGIIDEIARRPLEPTQPKHEPETGGSGKGGASSPNKRVAPSTPSKSPSKKPKHDSPNGQPQITAFFTPGKRASTSDEPTPTKEEGPKFSLHLSDTKTRMRPSLPTDEDAFASRLQLMLYHRLLSNLVAPAAPSIRAPAPLDFAALWRRVRVDPTRRFSEGFLAQAGLAPPLSSAKPDSSAALTPTASSAPPVSASLSSLDDLTAAWTHAVQALRVSAVDTTLSLVYRLQPKRRRSGKRRKGPSDNLSAQEVQDLAAAVQASVRDVQGVVGDAVDPDLDLTRAIFESLKESLASERPAGGDLGVVADPFGVPISEAEGSTTLEGEACLYDDSADTLGVRDALGRDPQLAWALQDSLLSHSKASPAVKDAAADAEPSVVGDLSIAAADTDGLTSDAPAILSEEGALEEDIKTAPGTPTRSDSDLVEADETMTVAELDIEARILGTKEFSLDSAALDDYLTRVLSWWHGQREPEGVSVGLTRRCMTCEYREGCEWREKKAQEAMEKYHAKLSSRPPDTPAA